MKMDVERISTGLLVHSEDWQLRLEPFSESVVRVTYTQGDRFNEAQSRIVLPGSRKPAHWDVVETDGVIALTTTALKIQVDRQTGALSYYDAQGNLLVQEPSQGGRLLEEIDVYKPVRDPKASVETVDGIDGIKANVNSVQQVFDRKAYHAKLMFDWTPEEALFGLGSHEDGMMNLRGQHQYLFQQNMKAVVPVLLSTKGYGVLLDCESYMTFHDDAFGSYLWCDVVEELDYYFIAGPSFDEIIDNYHQLTGRPPMLPRWAFGYMQCKERYRTQAELIEIASEYRRRGIPLDTMILDWQSWPGNLWGQKTLDPERFPDPDQMMQDLHAMNVRLMISIWPNMSAGGDNYRDFTEQGLMLGDQTHYNPYDKKGRDLYWQQTNSGLFQHGIDAWWCDCSEPFEADWRGEIKPEPEERALINTGEAKKFIDPGEIMVYSLLHSQGIYEGQRSVSSAKRVVNLTRSSYAGQHRYATITWSGDTSANWETYRKQIADGVNFCATGEPYWTIDIGAFFINGRIKQKRVFNGKTMRTPWFMSGDYDRGVEDLGYRELYVRWFQYGAFLPIFRAHGTGTPREIWRFGEPGDLFYDTLVKFIQLRYRLLPYIYSLAGQITHHGYTMLRALAFDFPHDCQACNVPDQFMFGPALMVCPVTTPMYYGSGSIALQDIPRTRDVWLPSGCDWHDWWTGRKYAGGQVISAEAPLEKMPIYARTGSIIPLGPVVQHSAENQDAALDLLVIPGSDATFLLYDDAGDGYGYESGDYSFTRITWRDQEKELVLEPAGGMRPFIRSLRILLPAAGAGMAEISQTGAVTLQYKGEPMRRTIS